MCQDAIAVHHNLVARGIDASRPFVGNNLWVTSVTDPDGYRLDFESPTDVAEGTVYKVGGTNTGTRGVGDVEIRPARPSDARLSRRRTSTRFVRSVEHSIHQRW